jgi:anti-anti-sigma factor
MDSGAELRDRLVELTDPATRRLVLDLADLEFINSMGLGGIVAAHLRLRNADGEIHLAAPRPAIRNMLDVTRLTKLFPVHDSVAIALASS